MSAGDAGRPRERGVPTRTVTLTGWGRTAPSTAEVAQPVSDADAVALVRAARRAGGGGVIPRGLGRSYNDAAQSAGGLVLSTARLGRIISLDPAAGVAVCEAGVSLERVMAAGLSHGWFVPVSPGTRQVTIGGAIAADVHGKNHHVAGSFARHVHEFSLLLPSGETRTVTPDGDAELFWATAGGMGLTGLITRAAVQLKRVDTSLLKVDTVRTSDIDETMSTLTEHDAKFGYTVAWSDGLARGMGLGRSVITSGDFAAVSDLPAPARDRPLAFAPRARVAVPDIFPPGLLNRTSIRLANEIWYRKAPKLREGEIQTIGQFFHPLDGLRNWNRVYGPRGFLQYQCVLPFGQEASVRRTFEMVSGLPAPSFVTVLKRFGTGSPGFLSFPRPGWALAFDFPAGTPALPSLLDRLDRLVMEHGGRVYLAKDSRVARGAFEAMYPRVAEFRALRAEIDPAGVFASDLSRRLAL
ncbi:MAG TPA: FAD-binding oxidoreductase [Trebonia sp.]